MKKHPLYMRHEYDEEPYEVIAYYRDIGGSFLSVSQPPTAVNVVDTQGNVFEKVITNCYDKNKYPVS